MVLVREVTGERVAAVHGVKEAVVASGDGGIMVMVPEEKGAMEAAVVIVTQ